MSDVDEVRRALAVREQVLAIQATCEHEDVTVNLSARLALEACRKCGRQTDVYLRGHGGDRS